MAASPLVLQLRRWLGRAGVSAAVDKRVDAGKTLALGPMTDGLAQAIRCAYTSSCIFPMGAVAKALLPGQSSDQLEWRPTSDHTRTGLNRPPVFGSPSRPSTRSVGFFRGCRV